MPYSACDFLDDVTAILAEPHSLDANKLARIAEHLRATCEHGNPADENGGFCSDCGEVIS